MTVISGMLLRRARILTFSTDMRLYARVDPSVKCLSVIFATGDALLLSAIPYQPIRGWRVFRMGPHHPGPLLPTPPSRHTGRRGRKQDRGHGFVSLPVSKTEKTEH